VLVALCYTNSITNAFILDDVLIVAANERIRHIDPIHLLFQAYWGGLKDAGIYRPFTIFTFSLEYPLWHVWAPGFRLTNLLLHTINGWLVFLLVNGLLESPIAALASAVVYVVHPAQTEAVVSIVGRSELLAAAFFFAAWLAFRKGHTGLVAVSYILAVLAKESAITLPAILMLDIALNSGGIRKVIESWRRFALLAASGIAYLGLRFYVLGGLGISRNWQYLDGNMTLLQRWMTSGRVFIQYFRLLLAPVQVTGDYDFNSIPVASIRSWDAWLGLIIVGALIAIAIRFVKTRPVVSLAILFFFVALLPVSNWILFHENAVRVLPQNARARIGYGYALLRLNKTEEAKSQFEAGLRIKPGSAPLLAGLASTIMRIDGRCDRVRPLIVQALSVDPGQWQSLWVLGDCFVIDGKMEQAEHSYRLAIEKSEFPDAKLLLSWGRSLEMMGKTPTAVAAYQRAALIDPTDEVVKMKLRELTKSN
jgi:hypothetical protein